MYVDAFEAEMTQNVCTGVAVAVRLAGCTAVEAIHAAPRAITRRRYH